MDGLTEIVGEILTTAVVTKKGCWFVAGFISLVVLGVIIYFYPGIL